MSTPPTDLQPRFVPTRAGIVNLWDYRDEEFSFAGGWLVLRGPNGSGKTKALEVLFPFVLDGRIDPKRLNPFAAEDRTMKSNLLFRGQEGALGYVWIEFTHRTTGQAVTCGIGLHAQKHRDTPARWHFVADGRIGEDFSLLTDDDRPLTKKQLAAELAPLSAEVIASATDYRTAVDQRLFGLGRERYEQLLTLILTLRRPQLAKNLDPAKLSDTLTEGLRPLDEDLIGEAARSFDDMESVQRTLEGLVAADEATRSFLAAYSTYLRVNARVAADRLSARRAESGERERAHATSETELDEAREQREAAGARADEAESALAALRARLEQLRSSAAYQAVEQLADLERLVRTCEQTARQTTSERERRSAATGRARAEAERAGQLAAELATAVSGSAAALADHAHRAGIPWTPGDAVPSALAERASARAAARHEGVRAVRAAAVHLRDTERGRDAARAGQERAQEAARAAETEERAAQDALGAAHTRAREELGRWQDQYGQLLPEGAAELLARALDAAAGPDGPEAGTPQLTDLFSEATAPAIQGLRDRLAALRGELGALEARRAETEAERTRIAAEHDDAPPAARGRTADRDSLEGALPLWQLVDFADGLDDTERAGVEAALEASGLLDALVTADEPPTGDGDGYLRATAPVAPVDGPSLADLLRPETGTAIPAARITAVLRSVAVADTAGAATAVCPDGRYAAGILVGSHSKPHAEYVGATARMRRRAARIAACDALLSELTFQLEEVTQAKSRCEQSLQEYDTARAALPRTAALAPHLRALDRAVAALRATRAAADAAQSVYDETQAACAVAVRALHRAESEHGVTVQDADDTESATRAFEREAGELATRRREHTRQTETATAAADRLMAAADDEEAAAEAERAARRRHAEEAAGLQALREAVGAEAQQVMARVEETENSLEAAARETDAARSVRDDAIGRLAAAEARRTAAAEALRVAVTEEKDTARGLAPYAARELLDLLRCPPGLAWPAQEADWTGERLPPAAVTVHEAILTATRELTPTESSVKQSVTRLTTALEDLHAHLAAAGQDYQPAWDSSSGVITVTVADEQGPLPIASFAEKIASHRRDQAELLSDSEQRILEDALLTRLAQQIHDRTVDARDLIRRMNTDMRERRMSSGTTVGVSWLLADGLDDEQRAVCALLDADAARLGPEKLARLRTHFAAQIKNARARQRETPYRQLLAEVLDYRRWRQFAFQLVRPGGAEERLTRARHSRLSGGEQSVSLHLPLFAAAHAMLNSAHPDAPRLLALDEAFAGVDDTGRGELMSLAAQFDLDLFMTGYDLWAVHGAVRAAAHYDLAHSAVDHTVSALLLLWDGERLHADDTGTLSGMLGSPGTRSVRRQDRQEQEAQLVD
ncbi:MULTISPECIES: TIGR02680 family protein [unclassified Streptomyces]|uniref:TIGR02680 family protein n=1 Tax=unclassified Streptomyces TaxID=2593676 RepID=UPI001BE93F97|nr:MULTISPECIES: TIGR02680 family protein [unclassified Streptomyces]MBT2403444.1 TIGR02680 family protein [Streptomyces sp. ISL-21]MBT2606975.1 TIGR02680 family protein [Streptomyces sp. ISL-87]